MVTKTITLVGVGDAGGGGGSGGNIHHIATSRITHQLVTKHQGRQVIDMRIISRDVWRGVRRENGI